MAKVGLHPGHNASLLQDHIERQITISTLLAFCWPHGHNVSGLCEEAGVAATLLPATPFVIYYFSSYHASYVSCSQVGFAHPGVAATVMVYLASDGSWSGEQCRRTVTILLSDTTGKNHSLGASSGTLAAFFCDP